jgi:hypothetical protein
VNEYDNPDTLDHLLSFLYDIARMTVAMRLIDFIVHIPPAYNRAFVV